MGPLCCVPTLLPCTSQSSPEWISPYYPQSLCHHTHHSSTPTTGNAAGHHQLGSATWTGGNSRRLKEAEGPEISIFGEFWPLPRPDNINVGITLSFFISIIFFFHSWTISQLCCAWKQNVSSHAGQHRADCLHKKQARYQSTDHLCMDSSKAGLFAYTAAGS